MQKLKRKIKGITLVALVVTIIVLLILAGVVISLTVGNNGLFKRAEGAANIWKEASANEEKDLDEMFSSIKVASDSKVTLTMEELDKYVEEKMNAKLSNYMEENLEAKIDSYVAEKLESNYPKARSNKYEEVPFVNGGKWVAPCEGYYCLGIGSNNVRENYLSLAMHYDEKGNLISIVPSTGYEHGVGGCELYMKKGEYLTFQKENTEIYTSKFYYAEGCKP